MEIEEWIQGETLVGEGNPYIVEFWATWCVPCRKSIPELNELYKRYRERGLTVIGISDEVKSVSKVRSFVKKQGDRMSYPVAIDGGAKDAVIGGGIGILCANPACVTTLRDSYLVQNQAVIGAGLYQGQGASQVA